MNRTKWNRALESEEKEKTRRETKNGKWKMGRKKKNAPSYKIIT